MKNTKLMLATAVIACGLFTSCTSPSSSSFGKKVDSALITPTAWVTNRVEEKIYTTNQIVIVTQTNEVGAITRITNREPVQVTVPAHDVVTPTAYEPNKTTVAAISTAGNFIPGYGQLGAWIATLGLGIYAKVRSKQYKDAAVSVAQGVEHYLSVAPPDQQVTLKRTLASVQADHGTTKTVRGILEDNVESIPKTS